MGLVDSLWHYLLVSAPYLLIGCAAAGILHVWMPMEKIQKFLGKDNLASVVKASLVGIPLPLCSCAVIPAAVELRKKGASRASTSSFLISTPETGVDSIAMTYALMDPFMTVVRPIAAFLTAFTAGAFQFFFNKEPVPELPEVEGCCPNSSEEKKSFGLKLKEAFSYGFFDLMQDMSLWLTFGLLSGAAIEFLVPADFFMHLGGFWNRFFILVIGVPLYICASATTPIAASLVMKGMGPGTALILLLVGPATNISNILVLQKTLGKKAVVLNVVAVVLVALILSFVVDFFYQVTNTTINFQISGHDHENSSSLSILAVILFCALLFRGLWKEEIKPRLFAQKGCH